MKIKTILIGFTILNMLFYSCKNAEFEFPDFDYQTVYFANQYPVRTVVFGRDLNFDNTLDQQGKIEIKATLGGTRDNKQKVYIDFVVDNNLLTNLSFGNGSEIVPMPNEYYSLAGDQIVVSEGDIMGGVQIQLSSEFFADPAAISNKYVIPLRMTNVQNADSILNGKDYVLYAVKYVNAWHGDYLRRGTDQMTGDVNRSVVRRAEYVERDEVSSVSTRSLQSTTLPVQFRDADNGNIFTCNLILTFNDNNECTVSTQTSGFTASGTGKYVTDGEKSSWGNRDRDALYLDYEIQYSNIPVGPQGNQSNISGQVITKDTLVMRDRSVSPEYFTPITNP